MEGLHALDEVNPCFPDFNLIELSIQQWSSKRRFFAELHMDTLDLFLETQRLVMSSPSFTEAMYRTFYDQEKTEVLRLLVNIMWMVLCMAKLCPIQWPG